MPKKGAVKPKEAKVEARDREQVLVVTSTERKSKVQGQQGQSTTNGAQVQGPTPPMDLAIGGIIIVPMPKPRKTGTVDSAQWASSIHKAIDEVREEFIQDA